MNNIRTRSFYGFNKGIICVFIVFALFLPVALHAATINFDDLAAGTEVTDQYTHLGATFTPTHYAVVSGISEGDPGNWGLEGTNGTRFLGFNGNPSYNQTITWAKNIKGISLDVSRSNGSAAGDTFTLTGLLDGMVVKSVTVTLQDINTWSTVALFGTFDEIQWSGSGSGFHPYGVDNLQFVVREDNLATNTINFDDLAAGTEVTDQYAHFGATFTPTHYAVVSGNTEGDPGNWGLEGTNGTRFLGFNGNPGYTQAITWAKNIKGFSLEVSRSNGSAAGDTFTLTGLLDGMVVKSVTVTLQDINTWSTVALFGTFDEIQWSGSGSGFHPYGVDNLQFVVREDNLATNTINFDDLAAGTKVTDQYAHFGATFTPTHYAVVSGNSEGDPGNWGLEGTNGTRFLGFNGNPSYTQTITWAKNIKGISLDVSRSNGSAAGDTFTLTGLLDGMVVKSVTVTLQDINTWSTVALFGTFDEIQWSGSGSGFHPYGVDNLRVKVKENNVCFPVKAKNGNIVIICM